ncbi:hypothetical protein [Clostridium botulinum]|uniref:hypothetical protein n=1 Tax=Clostridium botulinum TaxID=1491 RepID=UPI001968193D|nr:hypothetical protein [Clostridium botulinum]MBN1058586.1 hypothetical protein [Clostridium botulinum]
MNSAFNINLTNDTLIKIITVIFTTVTTYLIAKYNSNTPRNLEIKQRQLDKVYLPIYKILVNDFGYDIDKNTAKNYADKIKPILWDNYELVYPHLHKLFKDFYFAVNSTSDNYQKIYNEICYEIKTDYNLLKKTLGYPADSYLGLFFRMDMESKFREIFGWLNIILLFAPVILMFFIGTPNISKNIIKIIIIDYAIFLLVLFWQLPKINRHNKY